MKEQTTIRMHRFHDCVAFDLDDTETLYLPLDLAAVFSDMLDRCCVDIATKEFTASTFGTERFELPDPDDLHAVVNYDEPHEVDPAEYRGNDYGDDDESA